MMSLFRRKPKPTSLALSVYEPPTDLPTDYDLTIVGEGYRQREILTHCGQPDNRYPVRENVYVLLIPDAENKFDDNAVSVWICRTDGKTSPVQAGYLSRDDAERWRPGLDNHYKKNTSAIAMHGVVVGGGAARSGFKHVGVFVPDVNEDHFEDWLNE